MTGCTTAVAVVDEAVQGMRRKQQQTHYAKFWIVNFRINLPVHVLPSFSAPCFRLVLVRQVLSYSAEQVKHLLPHVQAEDHAVGQVLSCCVDEHSSNDVHMCKRKVMQASDLVCSPTWLGMSTEGSDNHDKQSKV